MRAVVQRTLQSKVIAAGRETGKAGFGLTVLLGIGNDDDSGDVAYMAEKIVNLRIFEDEDGKMNQSLLQKNCMKRLSRLSEKKELPSGRASFARKWSYLSTITVP